jgi:protein gp37
MAKDTSIEWTDHTFNPWWGCTKVSPGCDHCYAEQWAKRVGESVWGHHEPRRFFTDAHWRQPRSWNAEAAASGIRRRVFCASMADVFEDRRDLDATRARLWQLIADTPHLDWQLLTKRPQAIRRLAPWGDRWPANVWLGTTVEDQTRAQLRVPTLLEIPARVRFLSCEPLLGPVDLSSFVSAPNQIHWIIAGGESGPGARPMGPSWARQLRDFCRSQRIAFHFKQWGHWAPERPESVNAKTTIIDGGIVLYAVGKKHAGRSLDGRTWNQLPEAGALNGPGSDAAFRPS